MSIRNFFRSKRSRQADLTEVCIDVVAGAASGQDKSFIESITNPAVGTFIITCKEDAQNDLVPKNLHCELGHVGHVQAVDKETIEVRTTDLAGVAADCDFSLAFLWHKGNRIY